jgi:hypothetical protein
VDWNGSWNVHFIYIGSLEVKFSIQEFRSVSTIL